MDLSSTRGLDASTALEFVRALRIATDLVQVSTIASIYQAGGSLFDIFNKVCLIYEGRMVYFGPVGLARQYFIDMGYVPKDRQTTPDFLVSVTDPLGRTMDTKDKDSRNKGKRTWSIPQTSLEFEEYYKNSNIAAINHRDLEEYKRDNVDKPEKFDAFKQSAKAEHASYTRRRVRLCKSGVLRRQ